MKGIIAHFKCIRPAPGKQGLSERPVQGGAAQPAAVTAKQGALLKTGDAQPSGAQATTSQGASEKSALVMQEPPSSIDLQVVTSEGRAQFRPQVWVQPFTLRYGETDQSACWHEKKSPGSKVAAVQSVVLE